MYAVLAELEFGASHDKGGEEVEGIGGRSRWSDELGELIVDELIGLRGDFAPDEGGFEDAEGNVGSGRRGRGCWCGLCEERFGVMGMVWIDRSLRRRG